MPSLATAEIKAKAPVPRKAIKAAPSSFAKAATETGKPSKKEKWNKDQLGWIISLLQGGIAIASMQTRLPEKWKARAKASVIHGVIKRMQKPSEANNALWNSLPDHLRLPLIRKLPDELEMFVATMERVKGDREAAAREIGVHSNIISMAATHILTTKNHPLRDRLRAAGKRTQDMVERGNYSTGAVPPGHPITWPIVTAGTSMAGISYYEKGSEFIPEPPKPHWLNVYGERLGLPKRVRVLG